MSRKEHMNAPMMVVLWAFIVEQCKRQKPMEWMKQVLHLAYQDIQERNLILRDRKTAERVGRRAITAMVRLDNANIHGIIENAERYLMLEKKLEATRNELRSLGMGVHNTDNLRTDIASTVDKGVCYMTSTKYTATGRTTDYHYTD